MKNWRLLFRFSYCSAACLICLIPCLTQRKLLEFTSHPHRARNHSQLTSLAAVLHRYKHLDVLILQIAVPDCEFSKFTIEWVTFVLLSHMVQSYQNMLPCKNWFYEKQPIVILYYTFLRKSSVFNKILYS